MNFFQKPFRTLAIALSLLVVAAGPALAAGEPPMKMPVNGACDDYYVLFEGVCILPSAMKGDKATLLKRIDAFKKGDQAPAQGPSAKEAAKGDNAACAHYKKMLETSLGEGVSVYNPETGKMEKTRGEGAEQAIKEAKEYISKFCSY